MKIIFLPQLRQTYNYDCGAKATESVLAYYGLEVREDLIMKSASTTKNGTKIKKIYDELASRWHDVDIYGKKYFNFGIAVFDKKPKFKGHKLIHMD